MDRHNSVDIDNSFQSSPFVFATWDPSFFGTRELTCQCSFGSSFPSAPHDQTISKSLFLFKLLGTSYFRLHLSRITNFSARGEIQIWIIGEYRLSYSHEFQKSHKYFYITYNRHPLSYWTFHQKLNFAFYYYFLWLCFVANKEFNYYYYTLSNIIKGVVIKLIW